MKEQALTALMIVNPKSRMGGEADFREGIAMLEAAGYHLIQQESHSAKQTAELIDQYHQQVDLVIIGGGDGTISSSAGALYRHKLPFAILPLGTANDLARSLGMDDDLLGAFRNIVNNNRRRINLGEVNKHHFFNVAHIGLGVRVTHELTAEVKQTWGVFSYLKAVIAALKKNRRFRVAIVIDGKQYRLRSIQLAVGNGRFYGGGNIIDENSAIDDGLLRLYSLPPLKLWELLTLAPLLRYGKQRQIDRAFNAAGKRLKITTSTPKDIHADGEPIGHTPALFKVLPQALEVILPDKQCPGHEGAQ